MAFALKFFTCLVLTVCIAASVEAELSCTEVTSTMSPCRPYLTGSGGEVPPPECCAAVRKLDSLAQTTADRQQACRCLQAAARLVPGISASRSASLPKNCGVDIPYPISYDTNCNDVK